MEKFKNICKSLLQFLMKTTNGMALGLFATLIVGTIIKTLGTIINVEFIINLGQTISSFLGVGIAVGCIICLQLPPLWIISAIVAGLIGYSLNTNPLMPYFCTVITAKLGMFILRKKTPVDIIIIPLLAVLIGLGVAYGLNYPLKYMMIGIQNFLKFSTEQVPFLMGILVAVIMGMALTAPISSVAIAVAISLGDIPLAAGAAVVGCSVNMIGFAIQSIYDNNIGKVISVGIGTSMLQFKNILKKPVIWLPTIITSAIMGPIATCLVKVKCNTTGAGMGTCALVGQLGTFSEMGNTPLTWVSILLIEIIIPAIMVFIIDFIFRKIGLIKKGDLEI